MPNNRMLTKLRRKDHNQLLAACDEVELWLGDKLWEPQTRIRHVCFPIGSFINDRALIHGVSD